MDAISKLERNIYGFGLGYRHDMPPPHPDPLAPLRYSCLMWADHLLSQGVMPLLYDVPYEFLTGSFLRWLESLSLMGDVRPITESIVKLLHGIKSQSGLNNRLVGFLKDAKAFVDGYEFFIKLAPLQIYSSVLVLSPITSEFSKAHWRERLPCIKAMTEPLDTSSTWCSYRNSKRVGEGKDWDGDTNLVLSPAGNKLVSRHNRHSYDWVNVYTTWTSDKEYKGVKSIIRLWDTATGKLLKVVDKCLGTDNYYPEKDPLVAFSPDSKMLAFVNESGIVVCDTATGENLHVLEAGDTDRRFWLWSLAFSPNSKMLVLSSYYLRDGCVTEVWDLTTCVRLRKLLPAWNIVAVISPNAKMVAAVRISTYEGDSESSAQLWNISTGEVRAVTTGQAVTSAIVFSPDETMFASVGLDTSVCDSLSRPSIVKVWDTVTGSCRCILRPNWKQSFHEIVFSPDSKTLASSEQDGTVRFWDLTTGGCRWSVKLPCSVENIVFSEDGRYLETNLGTISAIPAPDSSTTSGGQALPSCIYHKGDWIYRDGRELMWVPDRNWNVKVYGRTVMVGDRLSGLVTFIYID
ncbi:YVTN repeat-like/Quino protein amine dehydrogenase [Canariomyces notabilis]|uniref:YVTN repeat-like/Quino protein amine dehydrogenase n=1 Tax=Canariomyces notabilis TaxID=2074819 RepID=A0AAN6TIY4_9PEZI|nr:YVTN repeat-like/Quino protein amine dehydrogenase [Canariomyces arenarius]